MEEKDRIERRSVIRPHIAVGPLERGKGGFTLGFPVDLVRARLIRRFRGTGWGSPNVSSGTQGTISSGRKPRSGIPEATAEGYCLTGCL